jgi:protein-S-isoprenylcysteine O-methyltransferase Ste14
MEAWYKIAFIASFIVAAGTAAVVAKAAARKHGASVNQLSNEVRGLLAIRAALGLVFYAALGVWMFRPDAAPWARLPIGDAVRWAAVIALVPLLAFFSWSFRSLGTNYRGGVGLYEEHELVTSGPYQRIRHPIYLSFIAIMVLVTLVSANWLLGASGLALVLSIAAARIGIEERELGDRFGEDWKAYRDRTGMFVPKAR